MSLVELGTYSETGFEEIDPLSFAKTLSAFEFNSIQQHKALPSTGDLR